MLEGSLLASSGEVIGPLECMYSWVRDSLESSGENVFDFFTAPCRTILVLEYAKAKSAGRAMLLLGTDSSCRARSLAARLSDLLSLMPFTVESRLSLPVKFEPWAGIVRPIRSSDGASEV